MALNELTYEFFARAVGVEFSTVFEDGRFDSRLYMANSGIDS